MKNVKGIEKVEDSKKRLTDQDKLRNKNKITDKTKLALTIIAMCVLHIMFQLFLILVHRSFSSYILLWFFGINLFIFIKEKEKDNIITNITAIVAFVIVIVFSVINICVSNISENIYYNDNYNTLIVFLYFICWVKKFYIMMNVTEGNTLASTISVAIFFIVYNIFGKKC